MIVLNFKIKNAYFIIRIDNKKVEYWDNLHGGFFGWLQYLPPKPEQFIKIDKVVDMSRNKIPANVKIEMRKRLSVSEDDLKDFMNAKNEEDIKQFVLKDAKSKGCELIEK